jgi:hypothetical protein
MFSLNSIIYGQNKWKEIELAKDGYMRNSETLSKLASYKGSSARCFGGAQTWGQISQLSAAAFCAAHSAPSSSSTTFEIRGFQ